MNDEYTACVVQSSTGASLGSFLCARRKYGDSGSWKSPLARMRVCGCDSAGQTFCIHDGKSPMVRTGRGKAPYMTT